jgi:predicted cupin superfamily sugar epimerase/RimJ/RimL family protein N-acetyltransferase
MICVRPVTREDTAAWLRMREDLWPGEGSSHEGEIEQYFAGTLRNPLYVLVAVDEGGEAVGFAELSIRPYAEECETDRVAYLEGWYVVPRARRRGVGRALIAAAEQWGLAQGCSEFGSDALLDNEVSAAAHRALGFAETGQLRSFRKPLAGAASRGGRADSLIRDLGLQPHPEGGHFAELFRSTARVTPGDGRGERSALTTIHYLLAAGELSRWHRVSSDEAWHFYEGAPLELLVLSADGVHLARHRLGPAAPGTSPTITVGAGDWQAARSMGAYSLVGCTVGPGFDFADFALARDVPAAAAAIRARHPDVASLL